MNNSKSLVALQFIIIILLLILNESVFNTLSSTIIVIVGAFIGAITLLYNKLGNFNIRPDIKNDAQLITTGPYKYIRHPMYTCVMLIMLGVVFTHITYVNLLLYAMLLIVLHQKAKKEELLWCEKSDNYKQYMRTTKMFIPYLL